MFKAPRTITAGLVEAIMRPDARRAARACDLVTAFRLRR